MAESTENRAPEEMARRLLRHTWHAFFGRFGRLTATQGVAIGPIRAGRSVVLCAPTASGKTEAVVGPLVDRLIAEGVAGDDVGGLRVLVICPTRALCNDLHRRIVGPLKQCRWRAEVKTGDDPGLDDEDPPEVLVTTPESFDSMLCRRPATLRTVAGIFVDEVHLLDGEPRGDHLRALLERQRRLSGELQICAASATAADAERLAAEFCGPGAEVLTAEESQARELSLELLPAIRVEDAEAVVREIIRREPGAKILVFANSRGEVEYLASSLSDQQVFAHHGSLSRGERLRAEANFLQQKSAICVATMTLELGVDIGDVDRVVLINPPPNVASFTQRVGRSNRRGGVIQATGLYSSPLDEARFLHYLECARAGRLFPEAVPVRPALLPQQALSLMFQNPHEFVTAKALHDRLPADIANLYSRRDCERCLRQMREMGVLHVDSHGRFVPDEPARKDHRYGRIHAHIEASGELEVVDETTGRVIGTAAFKEDTSRLLLGGRHHDVTALRDRQIFVSTTEGEGEAQFLTRVGPRYSFTLAQDLSRFLGQEAFGIEAVPNGEGQYLLRHFLGTLWGRLLAICLREQGHTVKKINAFTLVVKPRRTLAEAPGTEAELFEQAEAGIEKAYKQFFTSLKAGPFLRYVPEELQRRWVVECLRIDEFAATLSRYSFIRMEE